MRSSRIFHLSSVNETKVATVTFSLFTRARIKPGFEDLVTLNLLGWCLSASPWLPSAVNYFLCGSRDDDEVAFS